MTGNEVDQWMLDVSSRLAAHEYILEVTLARAMAVSDPAFARQFMETLAAPKPQVIPLGRTVADFPHLDAQGRGTDQIIVRFAEKVMAREQHLRNGGLRSLIPG